MIQICGGKVIWQEIGNKPFSLIIVICSLFRFRGTMQVEIVSGKNKVDIFFICLHILKTFCPAVFFTIDSFSLMYTAQNLSLMSKKIVVAQKGKRIIVPDIPLTLKWTHFVKNQNQGNFYKINYRNTFLTNFPSLYRLCLRK